MPYWSFETLLPSLVYNFCIYEFYYFYVNDINADFTDQIRPICLPLNEPLRSRDLTGYQPFIAGWGATTYQVSFCFLKKWSTKQSDFGVIIAWTLIGTCIVYTTRSSNTHSFKFRLWTQLSFIFSESNFW